MLRAAASNQAVICVSNPAKHYAKLMKFMSEDNGCTHRAACRVCQGCLCPFGRV